MVSQSALISSAPRVVPSVLGAVLVSFALGGAALAQTVYYLPHFELNDMSEDGRTAIGLHYYPIAPGEGTRVAATWSIDGGFRDFGFDPSFPASTTYSQGEAISGDGSTCFGYTNRGSYRYSGPGSYQFLPNNLAPAYKMSFTQASRDGSAAIGYMYIPNVPFPSTTQIRWTAATGVQYIGLGGTFAQATGMSHDGNTVVGYGLQSGPGINRAWTWNTTTGNRQLLGLYGFEDAAAYAVTGDGRTVVGYSKTLGENDFESEAVIWRDGVVSALGRIDGYNRGQASSISDDGSIILGLMEGTTVSGTRSVIWTPEGGPQLLSDYFHQLGVVLPEPFASEPSWRVSANGKTLYYLGGSESYIVTIPTPVGISILASVGCFCVIRRRRKSDV